MSVIKDGAGTGNTLRINEENRADVESVSRSIDQHINELYQKYFSLPFDAIDPTGADDYFFYLNNTGTKNIHVTDIRVRSTVAGVVEVRSVTGTASSGTTVVPVNRSIGSSESLVATIETGADITGLSNTGVIFYQSLDTANEENHLKISAHIIIPPGQAIALLWDTSTGILSGVVSAYEDQGVT
jgi:hypothetical protein